MQAALSSDKKKKNDWRPNFVDHANKCNLPDVRTSATKETSPACHMFFLPWRESAKHEAAYYLFDTTQTSSVGLRMHDVPGILHGVILLNTTVVRPITPITPTRKRQIVNILNTL